MLVDFGVGVGSLLTLRDLHGLFKLLIASGTWTFVIGGSLSARITRLVSLRVVSGGVLRLGPPRNFWHLERRSDLGPAGICIEETFGVFGVTSRPSLFFGPFCIRGGLQSGDSLLPSLHLLLALVETESIGLLLRSIIAMSHDLRI